MANDPLTAPVAPASRVEALAPAASRHARKLAAFDAQLRQQGAVIEALKLKVRHATDRAEADERLIAEQASLVARLSRDLKGAVDQLRALVAEAAGEVAG